MSITVENPTSDEVHETFSMLLMGRDCAVTITAPKAPAAGDFVAVYRRADGAPGAAWTLDLRTGATSAGALVAMPRGRIEDAIAAGVLDEALEANLFEVANVLGALVNGPSSDHLLLTGVHDGAQLEADVLALVAEPRINVGYAITVDGGPVGHLNIILGA